MNIKDAILFYQNKGYEYADAESKVSQDIVLSKIWNSKYKNNITIKGGVVMYNISNNIRRATRDLDIDFIKYSLEDESIRNFIYSLNNDKDNIKIEIVGNIASLHHQDYDGKRVLIKISDKYGNSINTKLDIGVHKLFELEQEEYYFDLSLINKQINLLINSKEQIFVEKLKSLLKLGFVSTRYKDIFDFYYLVNISKLNKKKLLKNIEILIFNDDKMRENNIEDILNRLSKTLKSSRYINHLNDPVVNWLDIPLEDAINSLLKYIEELSEEKVEI
ncbi:MAG: nucleotidyl transferase AbiEii/AbiGii toxin family protein [Bacilli bacterium]|nr:nucleotidyl transferase AbiEii/AbiGii toxin family protein [Bacilli bacterium]MDY4618634.1 nucleotidyl transferase AbiEii/AbiGii toxin family protein [Bacilli bacterium]